MCDLSGTTAESVAMFILCEMSFYLDAVVAVGLACLAVLAALRALKWVRAAYGR